ncbi:ComEC/Rec2 family competence protein [Algibacter sp. Ld11]|uniref:ComEC/Rec2 family competence protein n=1 Tax=Algibacter sp. Ld11 TaxID=649150 RepID=UPI0038640AD9
MAHKFVGLSKDHKKIYLYELNTNTGKLKKERQVLWGDWLSIKDNHDFSEIGTGWLAINWSPNTPNAKTLFIKETDTTDTRPLEIIFVDVGQGDGAVLITPERNEEERIMVIDAGEGKNMKTFLEGRFAHRGFQFEAAIITHPDMDHYYGFKSIFENKTVGFNTIFHNGLVERPVSGTFDKVGGYFEDPSTGKKYIKNLAISKTEIEEHFSDTSTFGRYVFPSVINAALTNPKIKDFKMLSVDSSQSTHENNRTYMPGFAPSDGKNYSIEVLGPVTNKDEDGNLRLEKISSYGKTKNGHSIILRLHYGKFKVLFGGDLNKAAEKFLLKHYTQRKSFPKSGTEASKTMINEAKNWFNAEVMKVCHHGAADVTDEFMLAVNPACFVISSGDQEGHVHPRPDLLGRLGKHGRGDSPVLLSTELQRSTREHEDENIITTLKKNIAKMVAKPTDKLNKLIEEGINHLAKTNVDVYGAIYLKTDGDRLITAFKIEEKSKLKKWFYFEYKIDDSGELTLIS